ncbi:MAG: single-stranded DNA-binding protein [Acidimicrobiia bacterium]|nr:single-stranded DNA-binding protein [Acidimicrobiia bacterium]
MNVVALRGTLSSPPRALDLPSGDRLVAHEVTVATDDGPDESVNVAWFDPPASTRPLDAGDEVVVVGRVRRRFFRTRTGHTASRTEVVADRVVPATQRARVAELLARAAAALE